ncbi:branched-chain amino acid ABC transporter substrate-binding protein [uncultured Ferrovibrio sp.]|jgi:branched-chain amino acid transport system substrate-binding protein|uniref:branched-chain amino acid ABC transporter substrate-binding protein n=1 Tax=uncultured Ferrovibrio sp. TaxID=1576913 RepID=UPI0026211748|nr:branched-chain amino acid ABC transporter substrate-binding protein [uncultured Ferrovibrio sp.]
MRVLAFLTVVFLSVTAQAQIAGPTTVRIAFIDPLSGPAAAVTQNGLNHFRFMAERLSTPQLRFEITGFDNKLSPQETLIQAQKAVDAGIRIIAQGNGSSAAAALVDFIAKHNERNPGREVIYLNYAAGDPVLTNEKCSSAHFRFDAHTDMKMLALARFIGGQKQIRKVYLINQDYSFGQAVRAAAAAMLKAERPDIEIVGDELHPLAKITDFSPYVVKIKASGADSVITGNWGSDLALLLKAAADSGLQAAWYTYYASGIGSPTAVRQTGLAHRVFAVIEGHANLLQADAIEAEYLARFGGSFNVPRIRLAMEMLKDAVERSGSTEPLKIAQAMSGATRKTMYGGEALMRKADHQVLQDLYIASFGPLEPGMTYDEEKTGWGWKTAGMVPAAQTALPTTCRM